MMITVMVSGGCVLYNCQIFYAYGKRVKLIFPSMLLAIWYAGQYCKYFTAWPTSSIYDKHTEKIDIYISPLSPSNIASIHPPPSNVLPLVMFSP